MVKIAVLGMGVRGNLYCELLLQYGAQATIVALCDNHSQRLMAAQTTYGVEPQHCYQNEKDFFQAGKLADALLICTQDASHFEHATKALALGYHILIEKPISNHLEQCILLEQVANCSKKIVAVCHELRYTPFAQKIKSLIDSGTVGSVVTINQIEQVGYYHQAHSYVRGSWRRSADSSPMILAKACHDLDLISYFAGTNCKQVSSFGALSFFTKTNQPTHAAAFCIDCAMRENCPYDALAFYQQNQLWCQRAGFAPTEFSPEAVKNWLSDKTNPYARCVFCCDNDVVDHQVVNMWFEGDICANLTMTAFSAKGRRNISIGCTYGEIEGDFDANLITVKPFGGEAYQVDTSTSMRSGDTHGGGDRGLIEDFLAQLSQSTSSQQLTGITQSVHSHKIAFLAEQSRKSNGAVLAITESENT